MWANESILLGIDKSLDLAKEKCKEYGINFHTNITKYILINNKIKIKSIVKSNNYNGDLEKNIKFVNLNNNKLKCLSPWKNLTVDVLGNVKPFVHCFCDNIVGNLGTNTMEEIWNGAKMVKYRKEIVSGNIANVCQLRNIYGKIPYEILGV